MIMFVRPAVDLFDSQRSERSTFVIVYVPVHSFKGYCDVFLSGLSIFAILAKMT